MSRKNDMANQPTPTLRILPPPSPAGDPYFYGWRMVPRWDQLGGQTWEKVPLTEWDVLHPEEEDFIVTNDAHDRDTQYLKAVFADRVRGRAGWLVLRDHRVTWGEPALGAHGPDVVVFENVREEWNPLRGTFPVDEMGAKPVVIVEVTSPSTRYIDVDEKVRDYHRAGVPLYIIADRRETSDGRACIGLSAYRYAAEGYLRVPENTNGIWVEALKVWVQADGAVVVCADENGRRIPDLFEQRDHEKARADSERERADAEKHRADAETTARAAEKARADAAQQRAEVERTRADESARKLAEMEAELKRLRGETN